MEVDDIVALSLEFRMRLLNKLDNEITLLLAKTNVTFAWEFNV